MTDTAHIGKRKIVIVGAGAVGSTFAYALAQSGLCDEIVLIDRNTDLMEGQVLDLAHGQPFFPSVGIRTGAPADYRDAQVIVIAAGAAQRPGESRLELLKRNAGIMHGIVDEIVRQKATGVMLVVSNPVDILTRVALRRSGWPRHRVMGSGTVLDSSRLRHLISLHCKVDIHNVHAYVLGEHGDSELVAWSMTHIAGMPIESFCPVCGRCENWSEQKKKFEESVRHSAYHIINYKGATCYAIGLAMVRIIQAVLRGQRSVLTVSTLLEGEYGLNDVCLSVPCIVTHDGATRIIENTLSPGEMTQLRQSAETLQKALASLT